MKRKQKKLYTIGMDVGGTSLKTAIVSSEGKVLDNTFTRIPINSDGSSESIIHTFVNALNMSRGLAEKSNLEIIGIAISTCGPIDVEKGIYLMKHKYASLYGINMKDELRRRLDLEKDYPIIFDGDSWSFLRGESWVGVAKGYNRKVGITLGTGLGSAFMIGDEIILEGEGVPPQGDLWCLTYKGGIIEDTLYLSRRGIIRRYKELGGEYFEGMDVKDMALKALREKDKISLKVFEEVGNNLGDVLKPILMKFKPECLVFGGQISRSFTLFSKPIRTKLKDIASLKKISPARYIDLSSIYGATSLLFKKTKDLECNESVSP